MVKVIRASITKTISDENLSRLADTAANAINEACQERHQGEYVDDVKWGNGKIEAPIYILSSLTSALNV